MADKQIPKDWPKLPNFKVLKLLGTGSYGKVFKVQRTTDEQCYALKEVELVALDQMQRNDAVNEIRLLCSINHPNVTRYNEAFVNGTKLYVVMEYAPFGELKYFIEKAQRSSTPFPEECVWRLFLQLAKGLSALHAQQIIHRDIKPANIFLCANDLLKIGDLGIAKALTTLSFTRTQVGTPLYMAPEVWARRPYSYSSDMWSLGCLLYEMMTLTPPFRARTQQELQLRIQSGKVNPIPSGSYSPELIAFSNALLDVDSKRRPSADQILASAAAAKWMRVVPVPRRASEAGAGPEIGSQLLSTILVPRDIRQLPRVLPPPSYDTDGAAAAPPPPKPPLAIIPPAGAPSPRSNSPALQNGLRPPLAPSPRGEPPARPSLNGGPPRAPLSGAPSPIGGAPAGVMAGRRRQSDNGSGSPSPSGGGARPGPRVSENGGAGAILPSPPGLPAIPRPSSKGGGLQLPPIEPRNMGEEGGRVPVAMRPAGRRVTCS